MKKKKKLSNICTDIFKKKIFLPWFILQKFFIKTFQQNEIVFWKEHQIKHNLQTYFNNKSRKYEWKWPQDDCSVFFSNLFAHFTGRNVFPMFNVKFLYNGTMTEIKWFFKYFQISNGKLCDFYFFLIILTKITNSLYKYDINIIQYTYLHAYKQTVNWVHYLLQKMNWKQALFK